MFVKSEKNSIADSTEKDISDEETEPTDEKEHFEKQDMEKKNEVTSIEPDPKLPKMVWMVNLCVAVGYAVNGVAEIHSEIAKDEVFNEFYKVTIQTG